MARDRRRTDELATRDEAAQAAGHLAQEPSLTFQPVDDRDPRMRWIAVGAAVVVALVSFFVVGRYASDPAFYANRRRSYEEILPWDHLDYGVTKAFLIRESKLAHQSTTTPNCRQKCADCGAACWKEGVCVEDR